MTLEFGQWYTFRSRVIKVTDGSLHRYLWRVPLDMRRRGVYIGTRTLTEGWIQRDRDAGENYLKPERRVKVYLFVENARENPVYVLPEDVIVEGDSQ